MHHDQHEHLSRMRAHHYLPHEHRTARKRKWRCGGHVVEALTKSEPDCLSPPVPLQVTAALPRQKVVHTFTVQ